MAFINLENEGTWFDYGDGKVKLRNPTLEKLKELREKTTKTKVEFKRVDNIPSRFTSDDVNDSLWSEMFWDYCIMEWKGLCSDRECKIQIPCTKEKKLELMYKSTPFSLFVNEKLKELADLEKADSESARKNS